MNRTVTLEIEREILDSAELQAKARETSVAEVLIGQLRVMAQNWEDSRARRTPITDSLRGTVKLPPDFDARTALTEELQKKYGR